ncbi:MAG: hypothetical protein U9Q85_03065 [Patescibacteria group bacterium]|nr:hypothetical protein [Patescibacteria group bacterium]
MEFLNKYNLRLKTILKVFGLIFLGLILLGLAFQIISASFGSLTRQSSTGMSFNKGGMALESMANSAGYGDKISARNVMSPQMRGSTGATAEDFEVTEYRGSIETRQLEKTCAVISSLKTNDYVIFETSNEYDTACNYNFKVKKDYKDEILTIIEELDPKDLSENTRTIKKLVDDYTSEEAILIKKKETIEDTLNDAIKSYDEIATIATQARDAESLAKIIDSKIRIIERLSQERININEQLDRLGRAKAEQLDRLDYIYFYINIYENKFIDQEQIVDSWKNEVRRFVREVNTIFQNSSIGIVKLIFYIFQFSLYLLILILTAKYGWKLLKKIWGKSSIKN